MSFLKDTKLIAAFLISVASVAFGAGSKTNSVNKTDFEKHEKAISELRSGAAVHEQHERDTDEAIKDLRETNKKIYETVIDIAQRVGASRK